jgi:E3 ubiquitin-protein ligase SHPRH
MSSLDHADRLSSGLTLTSCRVVHLLEPVLKHSFELQGVSSTHFKSS